MENKHKLSINQWALEDRPREKMMKKGAAALSDAELLAILIGSGNTEESAVELMRRLLLSCDNNLNSLAKWEVCDYSRFKGMGPAKSITVMAALELGKRRKLQDIKERLRITCSKDIYDIFQPLMCDLEQEEFWVLLLNQATTDRQSPYKYRRNRWDICRCAYNSSGSTLAKGYTDSCSSQSSLGEYSSQSAG